MIPLSNRGHTPPKVTINNDGRLEPFTDEDGEQLKHLNYKKIVHSEREAIRKKLYDGLKEYCYWRGLHLDSAKTIAASTEANLIEMLDILITEKLLPK